MTSIRFSNLRIRSRMNPKCLKDYVVSYQNFNGIEKLETEKTENSVKCSCGKSISISAKIDKSICSWCGRTVINTTKNHFKYVVRKRLNTNVIEKRGEFK